MQLSNCPNCSKTKFTYKEKLRLLSDEYALKCSECNSYIGIHWLIKLLLGLLIFSSFPFSFGYFFGQLGFLGGVGSAFTVPVILFLVFSVLCPLSKKKAKGIRE